MQRFFLDHQQVHAQACASLGLQQASHPRCLWHDGPAWLPMLAGRTQATGVSPLVGRATKPRGRLAGPQTAHRTALEVQNLPQRSVV